MINSRGRTTNDRGTTLIEAAITLTVFLTLILGMFDLAIAVFRHHLVSQAARTGARQAIVHGSLAPSNWNGGPWGPSQFGPVTASSTDPKVAAIVPYLAGMDPNAVSITIQWPDGSNTTQSRVKVQVSTKWTPIMGLIFGGASRPLQATSMMPIAH